MSHLYSKIIATIAFFFCGANLLFSQTSYGRSIINYKGNSIAAIEDLKESLSTYDAGYIQIVNVPLEDRTGQEFFLSVTGNKTEIKYTTQQSLENAIYTYLDMLGFRWYGPGDVWFVKPKSIKNLDITGKWIKPSFRNRSFFGTGGLDFGAGQPYDLQNIYKQKWHDWKRRNRYNADFNDIGHTGAAFYNDNRALLDRNPNWFSSEQGKYNGRLKIDQKEAVQVYKNWIRGKYQKNTLSFIALGVDPEDGRGGTDDPLPLKMPAIKTHADKWWWLANEVAKDYPETSLQTVITAYAYGNGITNALVPSFQLRKNVYPIIIPYAFQQAYEPSEMVKVWAGKVSGNMGLYDYWNITQWSLGAPQFNIYGILDRLIFWKNNKIDGVYLETTDAAGPMGHALWLAGQLQWDINKNFERIYSQYLDECFGKASPYLRNMFDRWSNNYQGSADVGFSLQDLQKASIAVSRESGEWKRIMELKAYVHFLKLLYEHDGSQESKNRLFNYIYSIHHLMMVQTAAFVGQPYIKPLNNGNIVPNGENIKPITYLQIEKNFLEDVASASKLYQLHNTGFDFGKVKYLEPIEKTVWRFGSVQANFFFIAPFTGTMMIDAGGESNGSFAILSENATLVKTNIGGKDTDYEESLNGRIWRMKKFKIQIEKGRIYKIQASYGNNRVIIQTTGITLFKNPGAEDFDNYGYPIQYFYVPKNTSEIVFFDAQPEGTNGRGILIAPDGKAISRQITGAKNIYRVPVDAKFRGKLWVANFGHPVWSFKNIPNVTSLQKFAYDE